MKTILLLFALWTLPSGQDLFDKITGSWKVIKVETKDTTLYPRQNWGFFLKFSKKFIAYTQDGNEHWTDSISINTNTVKLTHIAETDAYCIICKSDSMEKYIEYSGNYELQDSVLIITTNKGKLYLTRDVTNHLKNISPR